MGVVSHRVLVTGCAGAVGRPVCRALAAAGHFVRGFDRRGGAVAGVAELCVGELTDAPAVTAAAAGVDTIVHLAATADVADFVTDLVPNNVIGLYRVFEAAREQKVGRVIVASTMRTVSGLRGSERVLSVDDAAPTELYSVTKLLAEDMGRLYAVKHGLSVLAVRVGWLIRNEKELGRVQKMTPEQQQRTILSQDDAGRFFTRAVEAQGITFAVVYAVSRCPGTPRFDPEPARRVVGYEPQDLVPQGVHFE
jgi:nucleoside-diphosphate-sugar epimerase